MHNQTQATSRRLGGRPRKPLIDLRGVKVSVALTDPEAEELCRRAEAAGAATLPEYMRAAIFSGTVRGVPSLNRQAYSELARLAGNLNQLAKHANQGTGGIIHGDQLEPAIARLHAEVQKLRADLLGGASS